MFVFAEDINFLVSVLEVVVRQVLEKVGLNPTLVQQVVQWYG